ncbi:MAG: Rieske (2Fe-2S) protein [Alphaproteobacteria bacterium]|nr:Rieske (2Fe-2S) protein [Alphaproteobacteria bacterium]
MDAGPWGLDASMKLSDISGGPKAGEILCALRDIEDGKAMEFSYQAGDDLREIFVHRMGDEIFAYENSCPHAYLPLNMKAGLFTEKSGKYFMCQNHGALFDIKSGDCLAGPCNGQGLTPIEIDLTDGNIIAR